MFAVRAHGCHKMCMPTPRNAVQCVVVRLSVKNQQRALGRFYFFWQGNTGWRVHSNTIMQQTYSGEGGVGGGEGSRKL